MKKYVISLILTASTLFNVAFAADYPCQTVRFIVPFTAGGLTDGIARAVAPIVGRRLSTTVVVENKLGASGLVGAQAVAQMPANGCQVLFTSPATHIILPLLRKQNAFDAMTELTPVNALASVDFLLAANGAVPSTFREVVADAARFPDKYAYGSSGAGTTNHLLMALLGESAKVKLLHVPYKGGSESAQALIGGQIQLLLESPTLLVPNVKTGKLNALAVRGAQRLDELPDVPTLDELGFKNFGPQVWSGTFVRTGTSVQAIEQLNAAFGEALKDADVMARLKNIGAHALNLGPTPFAKMLAEDAQAWQKAVTQLKLEKE